MNPGGAAAAASSSSLRRLSIPNLRAAWWAMWTALSTRRRLQTAGLEPALAPPPPPPLPAEAERGVQAALRRRGDTCLVKSIVLQTWYAAHGKRLDLIIGVKASGEEFGAHAWLEGEAPHDDGPFLELVRRPAP